MIQWLFGGKVDLQGGFLNTLTIVSTDVKIATWSSEMIELQNRLINIAQKRQSDQDQKFMLRKQNNTMRTQFDVNSFVLVLYPKSVMGQKAPTILCMTLCKTKMY